MDGILLDLILINYFPKLTVPLKEVYKIMDSCYTSFVSFKFITGTIKEEANPLENIIYYFSGTGNSLAVARDIAEKMGNTEIIAITQSTKHKELDDYKRIGFVFPVYYAFMPPIVAKFIDKMDFSQHQYIFGVATAGMQSGFTFKQLSSLISSKNGTLNAFFKVQMPGNYIAEYSAFPTLMQKIIFRKSEKKVIMIAESVVKKRVTKIQKESLILRPMEKKCLEIIDGFGESAKNFNINSQCNQCQLCLKICPTKNISFIDDTLQWGEQCQKCMACIQWCPQRAINYGDKTASRKRYHNPKVREKDLINNEND